MAIQRAVLLIADIGGYTRFMKIHRINLAHAQDVIARLLEAVIDASRSPLKLAKLEGDAAFFYGPIKEGKNVEAGEIERQVVDIRRAFLERLAFINTNRVCTCDGCTNVNELKLKFVAHLGDVAVQKVKRLSELAGVDVIVVHRMLKNDVPISEYLLMTNALYETVGPGFRQHARSLDHDFEGIGQVKTYYVDLATVVADAPSTVRASKPRLFLEWLGLQIRSIPYLLGLKKGLRGFAEPSPAVNAQSSVAAP